jgi:WD repeat-containing protein 23
MSMKFSGNNQEIVAGTNRNQMMVYDLAANKLDVQVDDAHSNDVNSVCFANREHSNIILSGSDDCYIKVWDRRALANQEPAGIFVGH